MDLVITEEVDAVIFGAGRVAREVSGEGKGGGVMLSCMRMCWARRD